ncbi:hypothetical protein RRG08_058888 [Elysia crispata]|uniref:Uncharacterized protein n=1 Tax=Elysia crispata TaxID=231223 RepID=A0AAE1CQ59_9GAST|nr:hypothetical protein RRG08_058888 [Elysia crispata]
MLTQSSESYTRVDCQEDTGLSRGSASNPNIGYRYHSTIILVSRLDIAHSASGRCSHGEYEPRSMARLM